jgi:transposase
MEEGQLLMKPADRDRLVVLKNAKKRVITQRAAAEEMGVSVRQVKRLLYALKKRGDKAVIHSLRGKPSNRRIDESIRKQAVKILSMPVYEGFGPTLASEYLASKHGIEVSKETVRKWMMGDKLWRGKKKEVKQVHAWRARRERCGELIQWDTCEHDWLEGRGERLYLIAMIDDATSRLFAQFVRIDSTEENMGRFRCEVLGETIQAAAKVLKSRIRLGSEAEQPSDEESLADRIPFCQPFHSTLPNHVHGFDSL